MEYIALENFSGIISMCIGEVRVINNEELAKSLVKSKYIKKYTPSNTKNLENELDKANKTIDELNNKIIELEKILAETTKEETKNPEETE